MKGRWKWMALTMLVAGAGVFFFLKKKKSPADEFRRATAELGSISITIQATGVVQPQNRVEIKPPIAGRAEQILVREGEAVRKGQIVAWMSSSERAALVDAARAKGADELKHWEDLYKPAPLVAPLSGVVIARNVEPGQTLTDDDAVLVMSNRLIVKAQVDETDIGQVKIGQNATVTLDAYSRDGIPAKVDHIAFEAKTVSNVTIYEVEVAPQRVPDFMRSGMTANVLFLVEKVDDVVKIPSEAIQTTDEGSFVRLPVIDKKSGPERREVKTGLSDGKETEIVDGLEEGETVLIKNTSFAAGKAGGKSPFSPFNGRPGGNRRR